MPLGELLLASPMILVVVALWSLPWKGYALWKAAQRRDSVWFVAMLLLQTLAILEILYIFVFSRENEHDESSGQTRTP